MVVKRFQAPLHVTTIFALQFCSHNWFPILYEQTQLCFVALGLDFNILPPGYPMLQTTTFLHLWNRSFHNPCRSSRRKRPIPNR